MISGAQSRKSQEISAVFDVDSTAPEDGNLYRLNIPAAKNS